MSNDSKQRDTSFSKTGKVIDKHGLETIKSHWQELGMYRTAELLNTSPGVIRYIVHRERWTRNAKYCPHLIKAVQNGHKSEEFYKTLDFSEVETTYNSKTGDNNEKE